MSGGKNLRKSLSILITFLLIAGFTIPTQAAQLPTPDWEVAMDAALDWLQDTSTPQVGAPIGEWAVLALARAGRVTASDPWVQAWLADLDGVLSQIDAILAANPEFDISNPPSTGTFPAPMRRWTDFIRVNLALHAVGLDASNYQGRNIMSPFMHFVPTGERHAINRTILADIYALIALQGSGYEDLFLEHILDVQRADGTWSLNPAQPTSAFDIDITAMALQALAPHYRKSDARAVEAVETAIGWLMAQDFDNPESTAQMIIALTALGTAYADEALFYVQRLLQWFDPASGGFRRPTPADPVNALSTVQAANALVAYWRFVNDMSPLFTMDGDFIEMPQRPPGHNDTGLPSRHEDVARVEIIHPGRTFQDIQNHASQLAMEALASRGIINGRSETRFEPEATMTRAEFAAIITRGLGLPERPTDVFNDVPQTAWFYTAVGTAFYYEIINGVSPTRFNPSGTLTRQEAAVMITRAARLCGLDTSITDTEVLNILAMFGDSRNVAGWAREAIAFCFRAEILDDYDFYIQPTAVIYRSQVAEMLYRLLYIANLL